MLIDLLTVIIGCFILTWSADKLVFGSVALAKHLGVAPITIGLTILALGTSLPEIVVSVLASLRGNGSLAIGNAIGSNIANIGLVIGLCALFKALQLNLAVLRLELMLLALISALISLCIWLLGMQLITGILMLTTSLGFILWLVTRGPTPEQNESEMVLSEVGSNHISRFRALLWVIIGLGLLLLSARILIHGAVGLATTLGVPEMVIGLTVIAIGTSLPELASSLAAIKHNQHDLVLGNIIGSNIFNLTAVLCPPALLQSNMTVDSKLLQQDIPCMLLLTTLFILLVYRKKKSGVIGFKSGILLCSLYTIYIASLAQRVVG